MDKETEKPVSKTGITGVAVVVDGVLRAIPKTRDLLDQLPPGTLEIILGMLVVFFRKLSDGRKPKIV